MTFDVMQELWTRTEYEGRRWYELFCVCRNCRRSTVFVVAQREIRAPEGLFNKLGGLVNYGDALNKWVDIERYVNLRDRAKYKAPDHVPENILTAFNEAATCLAVECWNAAGAMFRLCVDLATRPMLPEEEIPGLNSKTRRDLGLRLPWLFDNGLLPGGLRELSACIREDGNDGAHVGTLKKEDADDLLDFTTQLLERLYTEPAKLKLAEKRRKARREAAGKPQE